MTTTDILDILATHKPHRYPWWLAFLLTSPVRPLLDQPSRVLGDLVRSGQTVLELGPGNGYFSVPIAKALGPKGRLIAVDIQPQMLRMLARRLEKRGLAPCLVGRLTEHVERELTDLSNQVDLVVAINVIHELPEPRATLHALAGVLRVGGQLLLVEPRGHVARSLYDAELGWAREAGLLPTTTPDRSDSRRYRTCLRREPRLDASVPA